VQHVSMKESDASRTKTTTRMCLPPIVVARIMHVFGVQSRAASSIPCVAPQSPLPPADANSSSGILGTQYPIRSSVLCPLNCLNWKARFFVYPPNPIADSPLLSDRMARRRSRTYPTLCPMMLLLLLDRSCQSRSQCC
jgi:hypothetical protein